MKDYLNSLNDFTKGIELQPENGYFHFRYAITNFALNNNQKYKESIQAAIKLFESKDENEKDWEDKLMQALCYLANNEFEKARKLYEEAIQQCSEKDVIEYGLEILQESVELIGNSPEVKNIEDLLKTALSK